MELTGNNPHQFNGFRFPQLISGRYKNKLFLENLTKKFTIMNKIDINYDFRLDSKCGDPDTDSSKLYKAHKILWNRILPCGKSFDFKISGNNYGSFSCLRNDQC